MVTLIGIVFVGLFCLVLGAVLWASFGPGTKVETVPAPIDHAYNREERERRKASATEVNVGNRLFNEMKLLDLPLTYEIRVDHRPGLGYLLFIFRQATNECFLRLYVDLSDPQVIRPIRMWGRGKNSFFGTDEASLEMVVQEMKSQIGLLPR